MKIAVAVTGASGAIYARVLLDKLLALRDQVSEAGIIWSDNARTVWEHELGDKAYTAYPFRVWDKNDFMAPVASGSAAYTALIICPCSMGTLGRIAQGISNDLVTRAADVMLKERRRLICVVRETPYSLIHLRNMTRVTEAGGIICPASPSFYSHPQTAADIAATVVNRALQLSGLHIDGYQWGTTHNS